MARKQITLGPTRWVHQPDYELSFFRDGNPRARITGINTRSVVAIQTSKDVNDVAGTFTITVKDKAFRHRVREMDVVRIRLKGHYGGGLTTVIKGVVDRTRAAGQGDTHAAREDTVIEGRCVAKYLQVTSLFLPVWDPQAALPTALIFGLGDAAKKVGGNRPYDIFRYLVRKYTYGTKALAGVSGIPNSRYWLDHQTRFSKKLGYQVPFLQFDENSVAEALKRLEILGFTEAWVDELGRVVYRQPQWDAPAAYSISTSELKDWDFDRGDGATATYVEVIPAGDPGIDSATAQALRAGRAPVPSSYINGDGSDLAGTVSPEFVIQTDSKGRPTAKGRRNHWYRLQRRLGVRPQQVTSPLIASQEQAQAQAEGLLRFFARATKGGTITVPGCPELRLGYNARVHGELEQVAFDRTFYIEAIAHDYVDGEGYETHVTLTHGRDPWDPGWHRIALPKFDPEQLADGGAGGGVLDPGATDDGAPVHQGKVTADDLKGLNPRQVIDRFVLPIARKHGLKSPYGQPLTDASVAFANSKHTHLGSASDHAGPASFKWATDMSNGALTAAEYSTAKALADAFGIDYGGHGPVLKDSTYGGFRFQLIFGANFPSPTGDHRDHVHFGVRKA